MKDLFCQKTRDIEGAVVPEEILATIRELGFEPRLDRPFEEASSATACSSLPEPIRGALDDAVQESRLLFIDFFAEWCGPCHTLDDKILPHPAVAPTLAEFHFLRIDTDQSEDAARCLQVFGLPTIVVLDQDGAELFRHEGLLEPEELAQHLQRLQGNSMGESKP